MTTTTPPAAPVLRALDLGRALRSVTQSADAYPIGRSALPLLKEGPMRVVMVALGAGAEIAEHAVDGPALVQVLRGEIEVCEGGAAVPVAAGRILPIPAGLPHSVRSAEGGEFLVVVFTEDDLPIFGGRG